MKSGKPVNVLRNWTDEIVLGQVKNLEHGAVVQDPRELPGNVVKRENEEFEVLEVANCSRDILGDVFVPEDNSGNGAVGALDLLPIARRG